MADGRLGRKKAGEKKAREKKSGGKEGCGEEGKLCPHSCPEEQGRQELWHPAAIYHG